MPKIAVKTRFLEQDLKMRDELVRLVPWCDSLFNALASLFALLLILMIFFKTIKNPPSYLHMLYIGLIFN